MINSIIDLKIGLIIDLMTDSIISSIINELIDWMILIFSCLNNALIDYWMFYPSLLVDWVSG